jgi:hypothetical protein
MPIEKGPADKEMAIALNKMSRPLESGFECDFHDSVMKLVVADFELSPRQSAKLKEIYLKYFPNGEDEDYEGEADL